MKQNASPGELSEAPRRRWKPGKEQHPGPENQNGQHMLDEPTGGLCLIINVALQEKSGNTPGSPRHSLTDVGDQPTDVLCDPEKFKNRSRTWRRFFVDCWELRAELWQKKKDLRFERKSNYSF